MKVSLPHIDCPEDAKCAILISITLLQYHIIFFISLKYKHHCDFDYVNIIVSVIPYIYKQLS